MAKWSFSNSSWTPLAVGDTTTMTANQACFIQGGSATQRIVISEFYQGGLAGASTPTFMCVARDSVVGVTAITLGTNGHNASLDGATAALAAPQIPGFSATTMPSRATTLHLLELGFNAFGGLVRWTAAPGFELMIVGLSVNVGEISHSAFTGGTPGLMSSHMLYEVL